MNRAKAQLAAGGLLLLIFLTGCDARLLPESRLVIEEQSSQITLLTGEETIWTQDSAARSEAV